MNKELLKFMLRRSFMVNLLFICTVLIISLCRGVTPKAHPMNLVFNNSFFWLIPYTIFLTSKLKGTSARNRFFLYGGNFTRDQVFWLHFSVVTMSAVFLIFTLLVGEVITVNMSKNDLGIFEVVKNCLLPALHLILLLLLLDFQWVRSGYTGQKFGSFCMTSIFYGLAITLALEPFEKYHTILLFTIGISFAILQLLVSLKIHRKMEVTHA